MVPKGNHLLGLSPPHVWWVHRLLHILLTYVITSDAERVATGVLLDQCHEFLACTSDHLSIPVSCDVPSRIHDTLKGLQDG